LLRLEELESRALPSASGLGDWSAAPNLNVSPLASSSPSYVYTPAQVRTAYGFNNLSYDGTGQTIAIVDAYNDPTIKADLAQFDSTFGLGAPPSFTVATPGGQPNNDSGWSIEMALDVEWAHVIAPRANILLVEAKSSGGTDLLNAVNYARSQPGVVAVSMSWGGPEFYGESGSDSTFTTPAGHNGVVFLAAAGDSGAAQGPEWPSVSPNVLAVGGTSLYLNSNSTWKSESGWSGGGGGYAKFEAKPGYQQGFQGSVSRGTPDVAYNADPNTGVYVYSGGGWYSVGGTSAGAPQWAGLVALADQGRGSQGALSNIGPLVYGLSSSDFHDETSGNNTYAAAAGYDLVTGRGSPFADRVVNDLVALTVSASSTTHSGTSPTGTTTVKKTFDGDGLGAGDIGTGAALLWLHTSNAPSVSAAQTQFLPPVLLAAKTPTIDLACAVAGSPQLAASALSWSDDSGDSLDGDEMN
jgi:subtilase family serine protease